MKIHLIAIGGAVMHNLAIALHKEGHHVTGSDDEIRDPAKSRLDKYNLLPQKIGWQPEIIDADTNLIILGMHARNDNPELLKAAQLGIEVMSFPDYVYHRCQTKKRVVIAGSHGKTTITSMIMHVLQTLGHDFDYLVGSQIEGFETMVGFSQQSEILIAEGDEYLASPVDRRPKFLLYHADVVLISGIAWDHINVFPTFEIYKDQFKQLVNQMPAQAPLIFYEADDILSKMALSNTQGLTLLPYNEPNNTILNGKTTIVKIIKK